MERDSSSIFPLQQDDEYLINNYQDFSIWGVGYDQFLYSADNNLQKVEINFGKNELQNNLQKVDEEMEKKLQHREIERQRRKEMAQLYASLRSVLPSKNIKSMRSVSDQIDEATKYIKHMQNKVRKMKMKRDSMKKSQENEKLGFLGDQGSSSSSRNLPATVAVQRCNDGIEVLIGYDCTVEGRKFRLSRILQLLLEVGLDVVECNCTKYNGRLNYIINSQVLGCSSIDLQMLQGKLDLAINQYNI